MRTTQRPRIMITRSREGNQELAERLNAMGFEPISIDTLAFLPPLDWSLVDGALKSLSNFDWVIFTSATGVKFFVERMKALHLPLPWIDKPKVAAVGERTSKALSEIGIPVGFIPSRYMTKSLGEELPSGEGKTVLLLRANIADPVLANLLHERGFTVREHPIYRTTHPTQGTEGLTRADAVAFASASAVDGFCRAIPDEELARLKEKRAFCIGPVTAEAAKQHGFRSTVVPHVYTFDALLEEIGRTISNA